MFNFFMLIFVISSPITSHSKTSFTSVESLIKHPSSYEGKYIEIVGYANIEMEDICVYQSASDLSGSDSRNSIWLEFADGKLPSKAFSKKQVRVTGKFSSKNKGHLGLWPGSIKVESFKANDNN